MARLNCEAVLHSASTATQSLRDPAVLSSAAFAKLAFSSVICRCAFVVRRVTWKGVES